MAYYFFPSCKATAQFKEASKAARAYVKEQFGIAPIGCCRPNHKKLTPEDTALIVCNNCAAIIEENTEATIRFLWDVIDQDKDFPFPDYHGEKMTLQDCWVSFEKRYLQETVRSLLRKMNIGIVESCLVHQNNAVRMNRKRRGFDIACAVCYNRVRCMGRLHP